MKHVLPLLLLLGLMTLLLAGFPARPVVRAVAPAPADSPADPQWPIPRYQTRPCEAGLILHFGSEPGVSWRRADGTVVSVRRGRGGIVSWWSILSETESVRWGWGTAGLTVQGYLGHGVTAGVQTGPPTRLAVWWYAREYISLEVGAGPFGGLLLNLAVEP